MRAVALQLAPIDALGQACESIHPSSYADYRVYLQALYTELKAKLPAYSYQRFAEDLGFKASTIVHQIIRAYRPLSVKNAEKISQALGLAKQEHKYFLLLVQYSNARSDTAKEKLFTQLLAIKRGTLPEPFDRDCLDYFSEWRHAVIWELIGTKDFKSDPQWVIYKLLPKLKPAEVEESFRLLERLGLILYDAEHQIYRQTRTRISTGHRVKGLALVRYHQQMLDHAKASLAIVKGARRDISAVTVNVSEESAQKLKSMIHIFQLQLLDEAEKAGAGDQVYQINIQLFPFTD